MSGEKIRERFAPAFGAEPWFELLVEAYERADDRDDEDTVARIEQSLLETAGQRGVAVPPGFCWHCDQRKTDLRYDGGPCADCEREERERAKREKERYEAMSPTERARLVMLSLNGLFSRDVQ